MKIKMTNKVYDTLKWIAQYLLPALGTLYFTLSQIWGFPYGEEAVGTITAIDTAIGIVLGISNAQYRKEYIVIEEEKNNNNPVE
jgi:hypothetical protein